MLGAAVRMINVDLGQSKQVKKDALWKLLIRMFRRFLKKEALPKSTIAQIHMQPLGMQGHLLADALGVPSALMQQPLTAKALLMLVCSHRITRRKKLTPQARSLMSQNAQFIWDRYYEVFNENSTRDRVTFFSDPLIQYLWTMFRTSCHRDIKLLMGRQVQGLHPLKTHLVM